MHRKKKRTLKMKLFRGYSLLFILMWIVFAVFIYLYFYAQIRQQVISRQEQVCSTVNEALQNKIDVCDTLAMNILYSRPVRDSFENQISLLEQADQLDDTDLLYLNASRCSEALSNVVGMTEDIAQVNLYDFSGNIIGYGQYNGHFFGNMEKIGWLEPTRMLYGRKFISAPHKMEWIYKNFAWGDETYISLTRAYKNYEYKDIGYVEIVQSCGDFFDYTEDILEEAPELAICMFNSRGECIYPYEDAAGCRELLERYDVQKEADTLRMEINGEKRLVSGRTVPGVRLTILISQPESVIHRTLVDFNKFFFVLVTTFLAMVLLLSLVLANKVTQPLLNLRSAIQDVSLPSLSIAPASRPLTENNEIEEIADVITSFNSMYATLSQTVNELLFAKSEEINLKILAVQAQMNPHFLYNNLTNIAIMAEEEMNPQIIKTCNDIVFMLRYIAVQNTQGVELQQELDYTHRYLNCMKIRYEDDLEIHLDIPDCMRTLIVPKLVLQPLVENSIKYGLTGTPPWTVRVQGSCANHMWRITVTDGGGGFSEEALKRLQDETAEFDRTAQIPKLKLSGMGLLNIYIRMKLLYREDTVFEVKNLPAGGASVTLGGVMT